MSKLSARRISLSLYSPRRCSSLQKLCASRSSCLATAIRSFSSTRLSPLFGVNNDSINRLRQLNDCKLNNYRCYSSNLPSHRIIEMPALSPTMESGGIVSWQKNEGDQVGEGDLICEIETDKSVMAFESSEEGYLAKILIPAGTKNIPLGKPVCIFVDSEADVAAFANYVPVEGAAPSPAAPAAAAAAPAGAAAAAPAEASSSANLPDHIEVVFPALSPTMETGKVVTWHKKIGDKIAEGDLLCEIETDKSVMGFETNDEGYLAHIILPEGSANVPVGKPLCVICKDESDVPAFANYQPGAGAAPSAPAAAVAPAPVAAPPAAIPSAPAPPKPMAAVAPAAAVSHLTGDRIIASPYARKLAADKGIDLSTIRGTGPKGRIIATDVESAPVGAAAAAAHAGAPAIGRPPIQPMAGAGGASSFVDIPLSNMRMTIAKRLLESKLTIPHYYLSSEIKLDHLMELRETLNHLTAKEDGPKISVNDFIIKASALACLRVPEANSFFMNTFVRQNNSVDVSVAVSTSEGLITPIVFGAHAKGLSAISAEVKSLAAKAREGRLQPNEYQGGTFTVSNLGMFGSVENFAAIINPPQSCILAVGGAEKMLVPDGDSGYKTATILRVTLSCDHRVVDGAVGAEWLRHFKKCLEQPSTMLL